MNIIRYLKDRTKLIIIYLLNIIIINLVLILDENMIVNRSNIIYMDVLSLFILGMYLSYEYRKYYMIYKNIKYKVDHHHFEEFDVIGAGTHIEKLYYELFNEFHRSLDESKQELESNNEEFYDFIISWVHAVKIPIAATRLLIESDEGSTEVHTLENIENEIDKIERYVEQTLYYSRSMSFSKDYLIQEYNLNRLVKQSIKKFAKTFIAKKVSLNITIDEKMLIYTDKKWFSFILEQLLSNALKYSGNKNAKIDISSYEDHSEYRLMIKDNGVGIKKEDLSRVFERGFTGFNGRYFEKSTGMGLYLASKLARKLGHKLVVESESNVYTQVTIHISKVGEYLLK